VIILYKDIFSSLLYFVCITSLLILKCMVIGGVITSICHRPTYSHNVLTTQMIGWSHYSAHSGWIGLPHSWWCIHCMFSYCRPTVGSIQIIIQMLLSLIQIYLITPDINVIVDNYFGGNWVQVAELMFQWVQSKDACVITNTTTFKYPKTLSSNCTWIHVCCN